MKKLMTMIAAAAMSFGLFAEGEVLKHGNSFEAGDQNVSEDGKTFTTDQTVWTAGDEAATFNIGTYDGDKYAGYGAEGTPTARRDGEFVAEDTNNSYLKLKDGSVTLSRVVSDNSIFVDQLVKFTSFDEIPEIDADAKIAIWKAGLEDDDGEVTNNCLYVAVGDGAGNVKNVRLVGEYENDTWYRLTIRDDGEVSTEDAGEAGFVIYIDGVQAQIVADDRAYRTDGGDGLKNTAKNLYRAGKLFTSIGTKLASFGIASVGYKGIGAIDDVIIDSVGPEFASAEITATIAAVEGADLIDVKDADGNMVDFAGEGPWTFAIASGSDVTLTFEPAEGYSFKGNPVKTVTVNDETAIDVSEDLQAFEVYATKVNGDKYGEDELYGMITSLVDGDVVTFNKNATIADGEGVELYGVTEDTTITVAIDGGATSWTVNVAEGTTFIDNVGVEAGNSKTFLGTTEDNALSLGAVTIAGELKADVIELAEGSIQLAGDGRVVTKNGDFTEEEIVPADDKELYVSDPEDDWYTYTSVDPEPEIEYVTFTVTYDAEEVENVTVTTNNGVADIAVEFIDNKYTVESNALVTVAAMAKAGYKNVTITGDNVEVENGVFTADQAESLITIDAEAIVLTATFVDEDGETELYKDEEVAYNTTPEYKGATPTKTGYTFAGWTPKLGPITEDATYKATYTANVYQITYTYTDGKEPVTVSANGNPTEFTFGEGIASFDAAKLTYDTAAYENPVFSPTSIGTDVAQDTQVTVTFTKKQGGVPVDPADPVKTPAGEANLEALNTALGENAAVWMAAVYGDGGKVPGSKLDASSEELIKAAAAYNLKVMASPVTITPEAATDGGFTFTILDADTENPVVADVTLAQQLIKYSASLEDGGAFAPSTEETVTAEISEDLKISAKFTYKDEEGEDASAGFMKVDLSVEK